MKQTGKKLMNLNDIFKDDSSSVEQSKQEMDVGILHPFKNHPFKLYSGTRLDDMVKSVKELGVLMPLLVRESEDGMYEILSGHNRWNAAKLAGIEKVPVRILSDLDDSMAMLIVTETNMIQRSFNDLCPSEKACVVAQHYNAVRCQGKRTDLLNQIKMLLDADNMGDEETCDPVDHKSSREQIGSNYDLSAGTIARYLKINILLESIKKFVDEGKVSIRAGVEISYLNDVNQSYLAGFLDSGKKLDVDKAKQLRELESFKKLDEVVMEKVLDGTYKPRKPKSILKNFKVDTKIMKKYFHEDQSEDDVKRILEEALAMYFSKSS